MENYNLDHLFGNLMDDLDHLKKLADKVIEHEKTKKLKATKQGNKVR
tara:strand:+ start:822 stop:962 length:141 start_codon:yes stop_codon:yes gene_type:complete